MELGAMEATSHVAQFGTTGVRSSTTDARPSVFETFVALQIGIFDGSMFVTCDL
jgi:hypothetical protein